MNQDEGETPLYFLDIKDEPEAYERLRTLLRDAPTRIHRVPALPLEALHVPYREAFPAPQPLAPALLEQAERDIFSATGHPNQVEVMHPDRWEKVLGLEAGQLRARPALSCFLDPSDPEPVTGPLPLAHRRGGPPLWLTTYIPIKPEKKRSLAERKARRAKRKQRRQR